jgi:TRAP-type C4-dicarboxylate transport system permease small subunit
MAAGGAWRRFTAGFARLLDWLLIATVAVLIVPVTMQIVSRYTELIPSYIWTEELARFVFIWMIMIGAMVGVREMAHFNVDVWSNLSAARRGGAEPGHASSPRWSSRWCSSGPASSSRASR